MRARCRSSLAALRSAFLASRSTVESLLLIVGVGLSFVVVERFGPGSNIHVVHVLVYYGGADRAIGQSASDVVVELVARLVGVGPHVDFGEPEEKPPHPWLPDLRTGDGYCLIVALVEDDGVQLPFRDVDFVPCGVDG